MEFIGFLKGDLEFIGFSRASQQKMKWLLFIGIKTKMVKVRQGDIKEIFRESQ